MLQHLVEDHQGHVQLLLVEHLPPHTSTSEGLDWAVQVGGRACCFGSGKTIAYPTQSRERGFLMDLVYGS
jgi:hypothetical protein